MGDPFSDALLKVLESEPAKNLLSPVTVEVGELLGTIANLARFYATDNLQRVFKKWAKLGGRWRTINAEEFQKVMPLLPLASMVSDDELQEKWAVLMESTVRQGGLLPSFGQTLSQLSVEEVRYLDRLWKIVTEPPDFLLTHRSETSPLSYITLISQFDGDINAGVNAAEMEVYRNHLTEEQKANYERLKHAQLVIEDLIRLGVISETQVAEPERYFQAGDRKIQFEGGQTVLRSQYSFAQYGVSFMQAVTPKTV
jgi:hypothetical protein